MKTLASKSSRLAAHSPLPTLVSLAAAALLAACGGGGGSSDGGSSSDAATVSLSGTAAKGLMAHADVAVYAVNADGSLAATPLASAETNASGAYNLTFTGTKNQPYVVKVSAKADGSTTHADEVSGLSQALPSGFTMRTVVTPASSGSVTTSASITPFTEMAVAAAAKASGGITATNTAQAVATVTSLLGFDPTTVAAKTVASASGADEQKLAVLLTAVSQLANSSSLGCASGAAGDKVKCVVDTLAAASSSSTMKLSTGSGDSARDVSAALGTAMSTVLADTSLSGSVSSATLATVAANLACTSNCAPASAGGGGSSASATAIAAAKLMFAELKADWTAMFSDGGATATAGGALNQQGFKFKTTLDAAQPVVDVVVADAGMLVMAADLYRDYMAGRTTSPNRGRVPGVMATNGNPSLVNYSAVGCTIYTDDTLVTTATSTANANIVACSSRFYVSRTGSVTTDWGHGFVMTPAADGTLTWSANARRRVVDCTGISNGVCPFTRTPLLAGDPRNTGTVRTTVNASGDITAFTVEGEWPGAFVQGGTTLASTKHTVSLTGSYTLASDSSPQISLAGAVTAKDAAGANAGSFTIRSGTVTSAADGVGGFYPTRVDIGLLYTTPGAEFEGSLQTGTMVWDRSHTVYTPATAALSGALRTVTAGVTTEFLSGRFSLAASGYASFDATRVGAVSGNTFQRSGTFIGTVAAPNRPTLELTLGATTLDNGLTRTTTAATLQYRSLVGNTPRMVVNVSGTPTLATLTEAGSGLNFSWTGTPTTLTLKARDGTEIGSINRSTGLVTFSDLSTVSLAIGI